ncbi:hypothetical protein [Aporhodopirellula aestuarii]|uniref:Uncharacterized protein n=1 Tax=Aporhodopirellula aestuarii TaxID=2950107 RepID=A0ABT0U845_9BACT|nr:hypothetical protein [Aporhodopirellula aestuarii]MCM2373051.1 hypothetical protein [Aporhodopirellula aestuarii]
MGKNSVNPFSISTAAPLEKGVFADQAILKRRGFLFRVIVFENPFTGTLTYSGWWFRQTIEIDGQSCWFQISWLKIHSRFEFRLPETIKVDPKWGDPDDRNMVVEINFSRGLTIRRFRIWLAGRILYDEIN